VDRTKLSRRKGVYEHVAAGGQGCGGGGTKVFFLDLVFLPEGTGITGYRGISEIPPIYRTEFFDQILNSKFFTPKEIKFVSILLCSSR
jgi:hypothetical protein